MIHDLKVPIDLYDNFWLVRIFGAGLGWPDIVSAHLVESWHLWAKFFFMIWIDPWFMVLTLFFLLWEFGKVCMGYKNWLGWLDGILRGSDEFQGSFGPFRVELLLLIFRFSCMHRDCDSCCYDHEDKELSQEGFDLDRNKRHVITKGIQNGHRVCV